MIKISNTVTPNAAQWLGAISGARNPMNSWELMDSYDDDLGEFVLGNNDFKLLAKLSLAGNDHAKYLRMLPVLVDINAPLYWWKEFDTYKVGTVTNSCSTMHKIHAKEFTLDDFSYEHLTLSATEFMQEVIAALNEARDCYLNFDELNNLKKLEKGIKCKKDLWWQMIQLLPSSYNQKRTVHFSYQVLKSIYHARRNHKLDEWHAFCDWVEKLPHSDLITLKGE